MTRRLHLAAALLAASVLNSGCAELPPSRAPEAPHAANRIEYGVVDRIQVYPAAREETGVGAILGGLAGGVIGHQVGNGRGKDVATIVGALGGAYAGHEIERANARDTYRITVRLDGGAVLETAEAGEGELRVGDRVRVVNGRIHRE